MKERPHFTDVEMRRISDAIWARGVARLQTLVEIHCPRCGANAEVRISPVRSFPPPFRASCKGCLARGFAKATEVERRSLAQTELELLISRHLQGLEAICPCCQALVRIDEAGVAGGSYCYMVLCPRCGSDGQTPWPPGGWTPSEV